MAEFSKVDPPPRPAEDPKVVARRVKETAPYRIGVGLYCVFVLVVVVHLLVVFWPSPIITKDVVDLLDQDSFQVTTAARAAADSAEARRRPRPPATDAAQWRADSLRVERLAIFVQQRMESRREFADSIRHSRATAVLAKDTIAVFAVGPLGGLPLRGISLELRLILLALAAGALGAFVHMAQSFATYVGNKTFESSWTWWYTLRPLIGSALAAILYFAVRGALFSPSIAAAGDVSAFGVAGMGALAGLFSKQAIDKLDEVFETLFATAAGKGDAARQDPVNAKKQDGEAGFTAELTSKVDDEFLTVKVKSATPFAPDAVVCIDDRPAVTTRVSDSELTGSLPQEMFDGIKEISVKIASGTGAAKTVSPAVTVALT